MKLLFRLSVLTALASTAFAGQVVMDGIDSLTTKSIPSSVTSGELVAVISSPDSPSTSSLPQPDKLLSLASAEPPCLACKGPTLALKPSDPECVSIALCSLTAAALVMDGITEGDVEAGLKDSRHAITLTALFRARATLDDASSKQTLILYVDGEVTEKKEKSVAAEVASLFSAAAAENKDFPSFEKVYDLQIVSSDSQSGDQVLSAASIAAKSMERSSAALGAALTEANSKIQGSDLASGGLHPPQIASAFVTIGDSHSRQARSARARFANWRSRAARGLLVDGFGKEAEYVRQKTLSTFDAETLSAAGLPTAASYRSEMRKQLQTLLDDTIKEVYSVQVNNLGKTTMKRFRAKLLKTVDNNDVNEASEAIETNAVALRTASFTFETAMEDLEVPVLGLTKDMPVREMTAKLNDELMSFPDSAAAKLKRAKQVKKVVSKERKPSSRAIDFGLDIVAMLRPDGFGSLQGFAGYQMGGNSLTFGVHNDADDPQVISQFGGVRPPLLRVQPKLRVDVEM